MNPVGDVTCLIHLGVSYAQLNCFKLLIMLYIDDLIKDQYGIWRLPLLII